jgi:hypothetical protein
VEAHHNQQYIEHLRLNGPTMNHKLRGSCHETGAALEQDQIIASLNTIYFNNACRLGNFLEFQPDDSQLTLPSSRCWRVQVSVRFHLSPAGRRWKHNLVLAKMLPA